VYLHIIADTLGSVGVIISSLLIQTMGWTTADPICSFCISLLIFVSVIPLLKGSSTALLQCTPGAFDEKMEKCLKTVKKIDGVIGYSQPHFWKVSKSNLIGTIHIQVANDANEQKIRKQVRDLFSKKGIKDFIVEIEKGS